MRKSRPQNQHDSRARSNREKSWRSADREPKHSPNKNFKEKTSGDQYARPGGARQLLHQRSESTDQNGRTDDTANRKYSLAVELVPWKRGLYWRSFVPLICLRYMRLRSRKTKNDWEKRCDLQRKSPNAKDENSGRTQKIQLDQRNDGLSHVAR